MEARMDNRKENPCKRYGMVLMWLVLELDIHEALQSPYMSLALKDFWKTTLKEYSMDSETAMTMVLLKGMTMVRVLVDDEGIERV
jgi:hypothetical protein